MALTLSHLQHLRLLQQLSGVIVHLCLHKIRISEIVIQSRMLHMLEPLLVDFDFLRRLSKIENVYIMGLMLPSIVSSSAGIEDLDSALIWRELVIETGVEGVWWMDLAHGIEYHLLCA